MWQGSFFDHAAHSRLYGSQIPVFRGRAGDASGAEPQHHRERLMSIRDRAAARAASGAGWMRCKLDEARSFADGRRRTKLSKVLLDYVFIPFEANAWRIGNVQQPVLQPVGILENGISPVLPFKPMCRFCDAHHMRRHFGVEMS